MKKNNMVKLWGVAFVVAILATGIFYGLLVNRLSSSTGSGKTVVVAAHALKAGTVIAAGDLKTIEWRGSETPKGTFEKTDDVVGKTVFDAIGDQELVSEIHLASERSGGGAGVPRGMRAVTIHVTDSSGVVGMLRAGQKVDVQVVLGKSGAETTVRTALEDLQVLTVNPAAEGTSQGTILPSVTLLAGPAQADVLAAADSGARVRLTLRNPLDDQTRPNGPVSLGTVVHAASIVSGPEATKTATPQAKTMAQQ